MAVTHKKRLFARHFAANADRRAAVEAAGYGIADWARTATRLLQDAEVLGLIEQQQKKELAKFDVSKIDDAYVLGQMTDLLERIRACGMGSWQAQAETKLLEMLGRYRQLFTERVEVGLDQRFVQMLQEGRERARRAYLATQAVPQLVEAVEVAGGANEEPR